LKNEFSVVDLVGPTLPALKLMLDNPPAGINSVESPYTKLVHGLLSSCLQNIDGCSGRSGPAVTLKTKNNLLAAVLTLTVTPATMKISKAALEQCAYLISQKLGEGPEVRLN
jgi:HEAT repeat-containing protein 5